MGAMKVSVASLSLTLLLAFIGIASAHSPAQISHLQQAEPVQKPPTVNPDAAEQLLLFKPRVEEEYEPKGRSTFIPELNLEVYDTYLGDNNSTAPSPRILIAAYDIFGYHMKVKQISDLIAEGKNQTGPFRVIVPDFYHGGWPIADFPPSNMTQYQEYVANNVSWATANVKAELQNVIAYYQENSGSPNGTVRFGIFGFCWGGNMAVKAGQEIDEIQVAGLIHPTYVVTEDAHTLRSPALLLPASDDPDMDPFEAIMMDHLGIDAVFHKRFSDMTHGWAGATGNWTSSLVRQRVDQVISYSIDFFDRHL